MLVNELINQRSTAIKRAWISLFERGNLRRAARIHLTSEEERMQLCELGLALSPTTVIPNGVDEPITFSSEAISADIKSLVQDGFDVLCFGRISWKKGIDRLIQAIVHAPNVKALIAGHDDENLTPKLQELAARQNVSDRVRFLPRQIAGVDKEALFKAARLFVLPSLSENFGNVICEAMIRGLPAVVNEHVGAAEILKASGAGAVSEGDEVAMARLLQQLLGSDSRRAAMGRAGVQYAKNNLTWDRVAAAFEHEYQRIRM
jgi:glycosyltransferase involved in cell wall biosynthesis